MTVKGNIKKERKKVGPLSSYCEFLWRWESLGNDTKILFKLLYTDGLNPLPVFFLWMWNDFTGYGTVIREPTFYDHSSGKTNCMHEMIATLVTVHCTKILMPSLTLRVNEPLPCRFYPSLFHCRDYWEYIVVGAGPAGLQLGHYLQESGRDYVIMEKASMPG